MGLVVEVARDKLKKDDNLLEAEVEVVGEEEEGVAEEEEEGVAARKEQMSLQKILMPNWMLTMTREMSIWQMTELFVFVDLF